MADDKQHQATQSLNETLDAAFASGDFQAVAASFAEDGVVLPPRGQPIRGRDAIAMFWNGFGSRNGAIGFATGETKALGETMIRETGTVTVTGQDEAAQPANGKYLFLWLKHGDSWLLESAMWTRTGQRPQQQGGRVRQGGQAGYRQGGSGQRGGGQGGYRQGGQQGGGQQGGGQQGGGQGGGRQGGGRQDGGYQQGGYRRNRGGIGGQAGGIGGGGAGIGGGGAGVGGMGGGRQRRGGGGGQQGGGRQGGQGGGQNRGPQNLYDQHLGLYSNRDE